MLPIAKSNIEDIYYPFTKIHYPAYIENGQCVVGIQFKTTRLKRSIYNSIKDDAKGIVLRFKDDIDSINIKSNGVYISWKIVYTDLNNIGPCHMLKKFISKYKLQKYYNQMDLLTRL